MAKHEGSMVEDRYPVSGTDAINGELCNRPSCLSQEFFEHEEPVCGTPVVTKPDPLASMLSPAAKRKAASEFIQATTGCFLPFSTEQSFRAGLKDGVLLCRMLNTVLRGGVQYLEAADMDPNEDAQTQMQQNIDAFLSTVEDRLHGLPRECQFSVDDLTADGADERPQISNCILYIRSACSQQHPQQQTPLTNLQLEQNMPMTPPSAVRSSAGGRQQHQQQYVSTPPGQTMPMGIAAPGSITAGLPLSSYVTPQQQSQHQVLISPGYGYPSAGMLQQMQHRGSPMHTPGMSASPLMDAHSSLSHGGALSHGGHPSGSLVAMRTSSVYGSSISAATHKSVQAAAGVTKLMQQCTNMLKERMFPMEQGGSNNNGGRYSPAGPDSAMKALGPVLEGVLGHLTEEYEKRLLAKDHDLSKMQDAKSKMEKEVDKLKEELRQLQEEAESRSSAVARAAADAAQAEVAILKQRLAETNAALQAKVEELAQARALLDSTDKSQHEEIMHLKVDCIRLREELDGLRDLHDRYKKVLEENRALYNTVQDLRGNIRVFCRIRPAGATGDMSPSCVDAGMDGDLAIYDVQNGQRRMFKVDRVFGQHVGQDQVYEDTQPLIRSVLDGYNVCIFAYGQTGSGKTHTMSGTDTMNPEGRGINYRALDDLFGIRDARSHEYEYTFRVQMLEIYNENLRDLLADGRSYSNARLDILATQASGCNVPGATQVDVIDAGDVAALMCKGASQRATSETKMNDRSSRSHQILTVIVDGVHKVTKARSHGCLHLIDLAGSERVSKSEASGDRLVEAQHINKSLSALGDVMAALAAKDRHVPYRNSKLTQLLQDSLQGQAKVMMFMHVAPEANMYGESVSTLKFATRVSEITLGQAKKNVVSGKVFEAHEEALKYQRTMESKEQQLQQLQAVLHEQKQKEQQYLQENEQLKQQLADLIEGATPGSAVVATKQRAKLQLPIQQMLATQQAQAEADAAAAAAAIEAAPDAAESALARSREASNGGGSLNIAVRRASAAGDAEATGSPGYGRPPLQSKVDKTPLRDQGTLSPLASARNLTPEHSQLNGFDYSGSIEPTPRATPRSARKPGSTGLPPRESMSSQKHMERLQSARQYGSYRPTSSGSNITPVAGNGSLSHRQLSSEVSSSSMNLKEQVSRLTSRDGSSTARLSSNHGGIPSSRSARLDSSMPLTARTSGTVKSSVSEMAPSSAMSMRQSSVYSRSSGTSASGSGGSTVRGVSSTTTSRGGSRWK